MNSPTPDGRVVIAMTGASGSAYAVRLLEVLLASNVKVDLTISPAAVQVFQQELNRNIDLNDFDPAKLDPSSTVLANCQQSNNLAYYHYQDFSAGIASGSHLTRGMVVCPCSMGTLAALANGMSNNLIHRAADVHLKEQRKLIVMPRETPLGVIALGNMKKLAEAGAVVLPAMPGFYHNPQSIDDLVDFVVARICDQLSIDSNLMSRWGADSAEG